MYTPQEAINKIPEICKNNLEVYSKFIDSNRAANDPSSRYAWEMKLLGYLRCLCDMEIITAQDRHDLYCYYMVAGKELKQ